MLTDETLEFVHKGVKGIALVWVIEGDCVYDLPLSVEHADIFTGADEVIDISEQYPDHPGVTVQFKKEGQVLEELQTSEYFGSVLLSSPTVLNLADYPYGRYVVSPHAKFDGEKFIITNRDVSDFLP